MILAVGEKVHIQYRRHFEGDVRRHFVGEVEWYSEGIARLRGFSFLFDGGRGTFVRLGKERTRLVPLGSGDIISMLPADADLEEARYEAGPDGGHVFSDGRTFDLEIAEFAPGR